MYFNIDSLILEFAPTKFDLPAKSVDKYFKAERETFAWFTPLELLFGLCTYRVQRDVQRTNEEMCVLV